MSPNYSGWTSLPGVTLSGLPALDRVKDVVDVAWGVRVKQFPAATTRKEMMKGWWCNASQAVQREPWCEGGGAVTTSSMWYSYERDCAFDALDGLRIHGMPSLLKLQGLSERELRDLAGEGFSVPISTVFCSAFYYLPWANLWCQSASSNAH